MEQVLELHSSASINSKSSPNRTKQKSGVWKERGAIYYFFPNCLMVALLPIAGGVQGPASPLRTHPWSLSLISPDHRASACGSGWPGRRSDPSSLCTCAKASRMTVKVKEGVKLALAMGTCRRPLQGLNHVLRQPLTFNTCCREFRVDTRNEALCAPKNWQNRSSET